MRKRTRRQFLEDSMFAAAGAASAGVVGSTGRLFAEEERQSDSPNEKLSVAILGVKGRGGTHIGAFAGRKDTEISYICDPDREIGPQRAAEIGKRQGREPKYIEDLREVMDDKSVQIVSIATPNHWHSLAAIWAMQAGKHVYVEKPVSHNVSEGRRCVQAARKYGRICQTGTQSRSNPGMIAGIEFARSGKIGEIKVARGLCYKPRGSIGPKGEYEVPGNMNYDIWLGPAPQAPLTRKQFHYDWHWQWDYGNGDLGNQGIHQMDLARWGLGVDKLCNSVFSYGGRFGYEDAGETANTQVVVHDYGDKSLVFEVRGLKTDSLKDAKVGIILEGTDGYVVMPTYSGGAAFDKDGNKIAEFNGEADHFANFLTAVRSGKIEDLAADIEEGHLSSALCHLGNISYRLGRHVVAGEASAALGMVRTTDDAQATLERTLAHLKDNGIDEMAAKLSLGPQLTFDPMSETFPEQAGFAPETLAQANAMLTRAYREPFVVPEQV